MEMSGSGSEEVIGDDYEKRSGEGDFDLPKRREENREERGIKGDVHSDGGNGSGESNSDQREREGVVLGFRE